MNDKTGTPLYAAGLAFIELRGDLAVFGTPADNDDILTWAERDGDGPRSIAQGEFTVDRRFWEFLGKPDKIAVGFATEEGWMKWVGEPPRVAAWMEAVGEDG